MRELSSRASNRHPRCGRELQKVESEGWRILESLCVPAFVRVLPAGISGKACTRNEAQVPLFGV